MYKSLYQDFLNANPKLIHMAAHSHHFWPDVAREGMLASYEDSVKMADLKWDKIMGEVVPKSQQLIARILGLSHPEQIAFASNTHELLTRLLSCLDPCKKLRILTTDSEFHSANRQLTRFAELENVELVRVEANIEGFEESFLEKIRQGGWDMIFLSQVFFNTGKALDMKDIESFVAAKEESALFCLDGYHAFCALPTDLGSIEDKIFYLAGAYKYAQGGEGMCFMSVPKGCGLRPVNTGWFASFSALEAAQNKVDYAQDGQRFAGSTRDFTAHYRFNFVWESFLKKNLDVPKIHKYIRGLQRSFFEDNALTDKFACQDLEKVGHFLTLKTGSNQLSKRTYDFLRENSILTDFRGDCLRFGFGLYLSADEVKKVRDILTSSNLF